MEWWTGHVAVLVPSLLRLAEPDAIDNRGVVELVAEDGIFWCKHGLEKRGISIKACGMQMVLSTAWSCAVGAVCAWHAHESGETETRPCPCTAHTSA